MRPIPQVNLLVDARNQVGEGVLWCERSQCIYWTDIQAGRLYRYHPQSRDFRNWVMPERLSCFAFTADENLLLLGLESRLAWFDLRTGSVSHILAIEPELPTTRINDGRCDRQGRFVFGTMDEQADKQKIGSFYRLNLDLRLERLPLPSIAIANSISFGPDGDTMYFCDSLEKIIYRWDNYFSGDGAQISVFANLSDAAVAPDGAAIDASGFLWSAQWGGARVVRHAADGSIDRVIQIPVTQPSCVCFGGALLTDLFVTTANVSCADEPFAGAVFHVHLNDVKGLPEVHFGGIGP